jgi:hypothetical protein
MRDIGQHRHARTAKKALNRRTGDTVLLALPAVRLVPIKPSEIHIGLSETVGVCIGKCKHIWAPRIFDSTLVSGLNNTPEAISKSFLLLFFKKEESLLSSRLLLSWNMVCTGRR